MGQATAYIVPVYKTYHDIYTFKILFTAQGGSTFTTSVQTLDVGCSAAVITEDSSLVKAKNLVVGQSKTAVYTFSNPLVDVSYC